MFICVCCPKLGCLGSTSPSASDSASTSTLDPVQDQQHSSLSMEVPRSRSPIRSTPVLPSASESVAETIEEPNLRETAQSTTIEKCRGCIALETAFEKSRREQNTYERQIEAYEGQMRRMQQQLQQLQQMMNAGIPAQADPTRCRAINTSNHKVCKPRRQAGNLHYCWQHANNAPPPAANNGPEEN